MTMQTDVLASAVKTTSGVMTDQRGNTVGRCRIKAVMITNGGSTGTVTLYNGSSTSGSVLFAGYASGISTDYNLLPGEGILATDGVYISITGAGFAPNVVVLYG